MKNKEHKPLFEGRYGMDALNWVIFALCAVMILVSILAKTYVPLGIACVMIIVFIMRALSKKTEDRKRENHYPVAAWQAVVRWFKLQKLRFKDRKTHVYKKCPCCRQVLRLKRKKGPRDVTCPYCNTTFKLVIRFKGSNE